MSNAVLQISDLHFSYKGQVKPCLHNISLSIEHKERFGLFGPNGAGKTTLMSLMCGLFKQQEGTVILFGEKVFGNKNMKSRIGFVPQDFAFYPELSSRENLEFFGAWYGLSKNEIKNRIDEFLSVLGLSEVRDLPVKHFSGGMKRRINIAIGVIHKPEIIFLDEPTAGVDVQSRSAIIQYLKKINEEGSTLIYTSHQLNEAEDLCTSIALIDEGEIMAKGPLEHLLSQYGESGLESLFLKLTGKAYRD